MIATAAGAALCLAGASTIVLLDGSLAAVAWNSAAASAICLVAIASLCNTAGDYPRNRLLPLLLVAFYLVLGIRLLDQTPLLWPRLAAASAWSVPALAIVFKSILRKRPNEPESGRPANHHG
jgi:hypothetical protein